MKRAHTKRTGSFPRAILSKPMAQQSMQVKNQDLIIWIEPRTNVLKELFGFAKNKVRKDTEKIIKEARKELRV